MLVWNEIPINLFQTQRQTVNAIVAILRGDFDKFIAPTIRKDILCFIR